MASAPGPEVSAPSSGTHTHDDLDSDRPTKVPRILAVQGVDHEDEEPVVYFESRSLNCWRPMNMISKMTLLTMATIGFNLNMFLV
jgi:hypothetical protein